MGPKLAEALPRAVMAPARLALCECMYECVCVCVCARVCCVLGRGERALSRFFFFSEALGRIERRSEPGLLAVGLGCRSGEGKAILAWGRSRATDAARVLVPKDPKVPGRARLDSEEGTRRSL